jgi:hypothetical protein
MGGNQNFSSNGKRKGRGWGGVAVIVFPVPGKEEVSVYFLWVNICMLKRHQFSSFVGH